jgi:hypothetical protein
MRHPEAGSASAASKYSSVPVINAGDGIGEHPTQVKQRHMLIHIGFPRHIHDPRRVGNCQQSYSYNCRGFEKWKDCAFSRQAFMPLSNQIDLCFPGIP